MSVRYFIHWHTQRGGFYPGPYFVSLAEAEAAAAARLAEQVPGYAIVGATIHHAGREVARVTA